MPFLNLKARNIRADLSSSVSVFLVALPLCLGIALASGAPLQSGLIAGMVGGVVVSIFSASQVSVSGPAAGLTVIVLNAINTLGSFDVFLTAVVLAGLIQILFSSLKLGFIADYVPTSVIQGMLSAIGMVIILKQIPHALGSDYDYNGDFSFVSVITSKNTFDEIFIAFKSIEFGALIIALTSLGILLYWDKIKNKLKLEFLPSSLLVVAWGVLLNKLFSVFSPTLHLPLSSPHIVNLPVASLNSLIHIPDFSLILDINVVKAALTLAIVASLESLLSLEAADKLDKYRRISNPNQELFAQGLGNLTSGFLGGIPVTSVVVRTSANIYSGAQSWMSSFFHGILLLLSFFFFPEVLNLIPLSCLASILIVIGFKLCKPALFREILNLGHVQYVPFLVTFFSILISDLLTGVTIGLIIGLFYVLKGTHHDAFTVVHQDNLYLLRFNKDVSFLNKAELKEALVKIPPNSTLIMDGVKASFIDHDIKDTVRDYINSAGLNNITIEIKHMRL